MAEADSLIKFLKIANDANNLFRTKMPITFVEFQCLYEIASNDGAHINLIGGNRNVTHQGAGRCCKVLEVKGFVEMRQDDRDARAKKVYMTPKGKEILAACMDDLNGLIELRLRNIKPYY